MSNKPPKDALLNELGEGQWIGLKLGDQFMVGRIETLKLGGVAVPGEKNLTPGSMMLSFQIPVLFQSGMVLNNLFRLVDPKAEQMLNEFLAKEASGTKPHLV